MTEQYTLQGLVRSAREALRQTNEDSPDIAARRLACHAMNITDIDLVTGYNQPVTTEQAAAVQELVRRRQAGEPVSRIMGTRAFWNLDFKVTKDVLDPRPDTELIIDVAQRYFTDRQAPLSILDLGTGSGCLIVTLLHEYQNATGVAVDISEAALTVACENAKAHNVMHRLTPVQGAWFESIAGRFDLIVSNPPYIANPVIESLAPEVQNHDPILALSGGEDGLDAYRVIISDIKNHLFPTGRALLEIGFDQQEKVARIVEDSGLCVNESFRDLAGNPRVVEISYGEK